jgi:hypothetical protein
MTQRRGSIYNRLRFISLEIAVKSILVVSTDVSHVMTNNDSTLQRAAAVYRE